MEQAKKNEAWLDYLKNEAWLDYFKMLQQYKKAGYIEILTDKHELYITQAALFTLCDAKLEKAHPLENSDGSSVPAGSPSGLLAVIRRLPFVTRRLRFYCSWLSTQGEAYLRQPFTIHVVKDTHPHDLMNTIVITSKRQWWKLWMWHDHFDIINY